MGNQRNQGIKKSEIYYVALLVVYWLIQYACLLELRFHLCSTVNLEQAWIDNVILQESSVLSRKIELFHDEIYVHFPQQYSWVRYKLIVVFVKWGQIFHQMESCD